MANSHGATITGTVNPHSATTDVLVEYGLDTSYGTQIPLPPVPASEVFVPVTATITGLPAATTYHCRIVATNSIGSMPSPDKVFTTPTDVIPAAPEVTIDEPTVF